MAAELPDVLATVAAGLAQQTEMLQRAAAVCGKSIEIVASLHPEAMAVASMAVEHLRGILGGQ
jgi:hypothetical protein